MAINRLHLPDISIVDNEDGNEVMIIEVKTGFPNGSSAEAVVMLRNYMVMFYTKVGMWVTPVETLIMRKAYLDVKGESEEGFYSHFLKTASLFGEKTNALSGQGLEDLVYLKMVELVQSINRNTPNEMSAKIASDLDFLLEDTQVIKRRV